MLPPTLVVEEEGPAGEGLALSLLLAFSARALGFIFVVGFVVRLFPLQPFDPAWQMQVCSHLLNQAALPLLALVLIHAASAVDPADRPLAAARRRWRGLAVAASLGFLLLLPLQGFATWRGLRQGMQQNAARRAAAERRSGAMLQAIQVATTVDDLQARMQRLQGPTLTPADRALPLPQLLRQLEINLLAARSQLLDQLAGPSPQQLWTLISDGLRLALSSLAFSLAFAAGAQRRLSAVPLLVEWFLVAERVFEHLSSLRPHTQGHRQQGYYTADEPDDLREIEPRDR